MTLIWVHQWHDSAWERDCDFNEDLVETDLVTDDTAAWAAYETAINAAEVARKHLQTALRLPTAEERVQRRQQIRAALEQS